jgi:hypothetical protein
MHMDPNCSEFMMMLDDMSVPYEQWPEKIVVDITDVDQMLMLSMMDHLQDKGVDYSVDEKYLYVYPKMMEDEAVPQTMFEPDDLYGELYVEQVTPQKTGNETLGLEIELFARKYIPEYDDAFGKFMYHAELIKNGHYDIHMQDMEMVAEPYRTILHNMIEKGGK